MKKINEGAEAQIFLKDENTLKKLRLQKTYRLQQLDKRLRKQRNKREFKVLTKLYENNINVPKPIEIFQDSSEEIGFELEFIKGETLKNILNNQKHLKNAFQQIILMHNSDITHGDLTTLNMILKDEKIYLIDFGLAEFSHKIEDKAVDLNLFFLCIKNEHPNYYKHKQELEKEYIKKANFGEKIIERSHKIEFRGRNK